MAEPGGEIAADIGAPSQLRASNAERERVIDLLKAAFVQGRLAMDELDLRVGQALTSRTRAELAVLTVDIPVGLTGAQPRRPAREPGHRKTSAAVLGSIALWWSTQIAVSLWAGDNGRPTGLLILVVIAAVLLQVSIISARLMAIRLDGSASGWCEPRRSEGGGRQASQLARIDRCCPHGPSPSVCVSSKLGAARPCGPHSAPKALRT
jgi:DUF1707 SHOCT-like domain